MERLAKTLICLTFLVATACAAIPKATAVRRPAAGGDSSGGGSSATAEFYRIVRGVEFAITIYHDQVAPQIDPKRLSSILKDIQIEGTADKLFKDGIKVDALNYPDLRKIKFNLGFWQKSDDRNKVRLGVHEILGLMQIPDPKYGQSDTIEAQIAQQVGDVAATSYLLPEDFRASEPPVICQITLDGDRILAEARLELSAIGKGAYVEFDQGRYEFDLFLSVSEPRQLQLQVASRNCKNPRTKTAKFGCIHSAATIDFSGEFIDASLTSEPYDIRCTRSPRP